MGKVIKEIERIFGKRVKKLPAIPSRLDVRGVSHLPKK